jgi:hypothetical protein
MLLLLRPCRCPHDDVAASQPEARGGCCSATVSPSMWVQSHMRVRAPAAAQSRWNIQALPVDRLYKFWSLGDMSVSGHVYVTQDFHTVNQSCLICSPVSIMIRNRFEVAKLR